MLNSLSINTCQRDDPWRHWLADHFLSPDCLAELKSVEHERRQETAGRRVGHQRLFIGHDSQDAYPCLWALWQDLHDGPTRRYFESHTQQSFQGLWPRLEVISDIGDFWLDRHHDHLEKRLTALIYTDHGQIWPGTLLDDRVQIETRDNRCMFFVPAAHTWHSYPRTNFHVVRRALQINYWTYPTPD